MVYGLGYHTLRLKGRGSSRSLGYHALRWMCVKGGTEFQKCGKSPVFLDPDPADLRKGWRRISEMWQILVFLDPDPADLREGWHRISEMWQIPNVFGP